LAASLGEKGKDGPRGRNWMLRKKPQEEIMVGFASAVRRGIPTGRYFILENKVGYYFEE